jgi:hypothetical protein
VAHTAFRNARWPVGAENPHTFFKLAARLRPRCIHGSGLHPPARPLSGWPSERTCSAVTAGNPGTHSAFNVNITYCPPVPQTEHYDVHQFDYRINAPVSTRYAGRGEWNSSGLSFDDAARCQTTHPKAFKGRRFKVPCWAVNDADLQAVIVRYLENRVFSRKARLKMCSSREPLRARLQRAEEALRARIAGLEVVCSKLCADYVSLRQTGTPARLATLESLIEGTDTQIIFSRNPARIIAAVVYGYYRQGLHSVSVAAAVGLKPPAIRQILFKVWQAARQLGFPEPERAPRMNDSEYNRRFSCRENGTSAGRRRRASGSGGIGAPAGP